MKTLELTEYKPKLLTRAELSDSDGYSLWKNYGDQVDVQFPTPKTNNEWRLTSEGWIGHIPLNPEKDIILRPKVELNNLFHMLEYAYRLRSLKFLQGLLSCDSLEAFYQQLAKILSRRIGDRGRKGFYQTYVGNIDHLPYICGRIDTDSLVRSPWRVDLWCHYENHTSDVIENQILSWTLRCISRSGLCAENVLSEVRRAYRSIQGLVTPKPISAADCIGRLYNRLNDDYEPLHALCRFFLEHSGPTLSAGQHDMLPFLIDMARLFELFVSEWLTVHLPDRFYLKPQEYVHLGPQGILSFRIDFVIYSTSTGKPICVADTKYKAQGKPTPDDFAQVVTYAKLKDCTHAFLIYPIRLPTELNVNMNDIRVQSLTFDLSYDLEKAGKKFIEALLKNIDV